MIQDTSLPAEGRIQDTRNEKQETRQKLQETRYSKC